MIQYIPGSGATRFGAGLNGAAIYAAVGSSREGAMFSFRLTPKSMIQVCRKRDLKIEGEKSD